MPEFFVYRSHPNMSDPQGVALVYESCPELTLFFYQFLKDLRVPMSVNHSELRALGLLEAKPKMYIFYRNVGKSRDPKNDLLKAWVSDEGDIQHAFPQELSELEKIRDELLGDVQDLKGGQKKGTALERSGRGNGNVQGDRCLTYCQSVEAQRGIGHPPGNMSQAHHQEDDTLDQLRRLCNVSNKISINLLKLTYSFLSEVFCSHCC